MDNKMDNKNDNKSNGRIIYSKDEDIQLDEIDKSIKKKIDRLERNKKLIGNVYMESIENFNMIRECYSHYL